MVLIGSEYVDKIVAWQANDASRKQLKGEMKMTKMEKLANALKALGHEPVEMIEEDMMTDADIVMDGWHIQVGSNYAIPCVSTDDGVDFYEEVELCRHTNYGDAAKRLLKIMRKAN